MRTLASLSSDHFDEESALFASTRSSIFFDQSSTCRSSRSIRLGISLWEAILNLTKSAVGAGALFIPMCFNRLGLVGGIMVIIISMLLNTITLSLLATACRRTGALDYLQLAASTSSPVLEWTTAFCSIFVILAPIVVYIRLCSAYLANSIAFFIGYNLNIQTVELLLCVTVLWPMSWISDGNNLAKFSFLGMLGMIYVLFLAIGDLLFASSWDWGSITIFNTESSFSVIFGSIATIYFSFSSHFTMPLVVNELDRPVAQGNSIISFVSSLISALFYLLIGICGYLNYGPLIADDLLSMRPSHPAYIIGQLAITFANIASFPLLILPARSTLVWLYNKIFAKPIRPARSIESFPKYPHISKSLIAALQGSTIILVSLLISNFSNSTGKVFEIIGSVFGGPVTTVLPAVFYLRTVSQETGKACIPHWLVNCVFACGMLLVIGGVLAAL